MIANRGISTSSSPGRHRWLLLLATAILVPAFLLIVAEGALRLFGVGSAVTATRSCSYEGRPADCDNPGFTTPFFPAGMVRTPRPYAIPARKAPGTYRIFIVGESAAWGDPDPTFGFGRYLEVMLRQRFAQTHFEVINTSITAINSHVLLPMVEDLVQYQPDLFIIYAGNNEVVGPYGPGTVLTPAALSLRAIRSRIFINSTRLGQLASRAAARRKNPSEWRGMEMFLEQQVRADSPQMGPVYENFAANLRDIVAVARHSGAQVLLSTVATNLKDCPPFASMHRANLRDDELHAWDALVQRGKALETAGSFGDALKAYLSAAEIDPQYAELQFRIARCLWAVGDFAGARERMVRAQDLDTLRFRADSRMNQVIRSVAASGSGIKLLDAAAIFSQESEHNVPGSDLFYEHVHMNPHGNFTLARAMLEQVSSMMPIEQQRTPVSSNAISQEACDRLLAFTPYDRARVAGLVLRKIEHPPFTNQSNYTEQVLTLKKVVDGSSQNYWETVAEYRWAIAQNPQDRLLHLNYGFFLHDSEPAAAEQQFRSALPYDHAPVLCNWRKFN